MVGVKWDFVYVHMCCVSISESATAGRGAKVKDQVAPLFAAYIRYALIDVQVGIHQVLDADYLALTQTIGSREESALCLRPEY